MLRGKSLGYLAIAIVVASVAACKSSSNNNSIPSPTVNPYCQTADCNRSGGGTSGNTNFSGGGVATLSIVSQAVFNQYAGRPVNQTSIIELNVNTSGNSGVYLGELNIRYSESNGVHMGHFTNGTDTGYGNNVHVIAPDQDAANAPTYRFFFEDPAGVIIVTMRGSGPPGTDTNFSTTLDGTVYFRNFNATAPNPLYQGYQDYIGNYWPPNPRAFCWSGQITQGPYDCRNFRVQPSTWDSNPVIKLGTFTGLDKKLTLGL